MTGSAAATPPARQWFSRPFARWSFGIIGAVVAGMLAFGPMAGSLFQGIGLPHEYCFLRDPRLTWLHVLSDALIGVAYLSISATLGYLVVKASRGIPFHGVFLAFGLFIVSCGLTHLMEVWVVWRPLYWLSGYIKAITAAASVATAVALFPLVPRVFALIEAGRRSEARRVEIEQLNEELERFNYSVAHDLRGPLRGIAGFSEALREDCGRELPPQGHEYLGRIRTSVTKMDALISDLLKYASIGRQQLQLRSVPLGDVLRSTLTLLDADIQGRHAVVTQHEPLPSVRGDPILLQVCFQNLIGNALKFVPPGREPRIDVRAVIRDGDEVLIEVTDNGLGIPAEARERVFRMFERFHAGHEGTGVGLAIVQRAIERMHGMISVSDAPNSTGTRFSICLPAA